MIFLYIFLLILGMVFLIKGADFFVDGSSNVAKALKVPSLIIGLTLVSIGTSLPELSVSVNSAIQGLNDLSFGNVIGSNIFNTLVVIGVSALFTPMIVSKSVFKYDIPVLIGIYVIIAIFGFVITPNILQLWESLVILLLFVSYMLFLFYRAKKEPSEENDEEFKNKKWYINLLLIVLGLAGIVGGGELTVYSAQYIALHLGMSEMLVALTIVSVGTSLPELVTSIVAAKKGENDIAVGNAIGSSIFNILLILGTSSTIHSISIEWICLVDFIVMFLSVILIFAFSIKKYKIGWIKGTILLLLYAIYLAFIIIRNINPEIFAL